MTTLLASGRVIDLALGVIVLELLIFSIASLRRKPGAPGLRAIDVFGQILAGGFLLLALRCTLTNADSRLTLLFLSLSFPAHVFDLLRRNRQTSERISGK